MQQGRGTQLLLGLASIALLLDVLASPERALAHGPPPRALTPLSVDARGLSLVRLSGGLAMRSESGFRFLCPALWGGDEAAPAAGRDDGLVVLTSSKGLFVVEGEQVRLHPASTGARGITVASSGKQLYALMLRGAQFELARVERDSLEVVFRDPGPWHSLSASEASLQLLALGEQTFEQLTLSPTGSVLARNEAPAQANAIAIEARTTGDAPYVLLTRDSGGTQTLGRFVGADFRVLAMAVNGLAGPVADGASTVIGIDQQLTSFVAEQAGAPADGEPITALFRFAGASYATVKQGLRRVENGELGPLVFALADIAELDPMRVPIEQRDTCETNWLHWEFDLLAAGITTPGAAVDAGVDAGAGGTIRDAGVGDAASTGDSRDGGVDAPNRADDTGSDGCSAGAPRSDPRWRRSLAWLGLLALCAQRRRRRRSMRLADAS